MSKQKIYRTSKEVEYVHAKFSIQETYLLMFDSRSNPYTASQPKKMLYKRRMIYVLWDRLSLCRPGWLWTCGPFTSALYELTILFGINYLSVEMLQI